MDKIETWAELGALAAEVASQFAFDLSARMAPINIAAFVLICLGVYLFTRPGGGFLAWLFPKRIYRSASFGLDIKIFLLNQLLRLGIVASYAFFTGATAALVFFVTGGAQIEPNITNPILVAGVILLGADFTTYWYHRFHHDVAWLWPIHALHHSAEELNPVTAYRHHPLFEIFGGIAAALMVGFVQGLLLAFVVGEFDPAVVGGANLFFAVFNLAGANLRHSHVWLSYPRPLGYLFISPAQHQVHHSIDPAHHNKNYGEVLAIWDWMFGTLYVPDGYEKIEFGLGDGKGGRMAQPHPDLKSALKVPLRDVAAALRRKPG